MDFLDPRKRRAHRIQLFIGYGLMAIVIGFSTWLLVNVTLGYGVDRHTGTVFQNGLVFIDAHPQRAHITLNGEDKGVTDARMTIPAGSYKLELKRDGYRTWQRGFTLNGGGVERFLYPFLFPTVLETTDANLFSTTPGLVASSDDHHWVLSQQGASLTNYELVDLSSNLNTTTQLAFAEGLFSASTGDHHIELVQWSSDDRHLLVKHTFSGDKFEFVVLDIEQTASSLNLNQHFSQVPITQLQLRDKRSDQFYAVLDDGALVTLDGKTKALAQIASQVLAFKPYKTDTVVYVTTESAAKGMAAVRVRDNGTVYTLRNLPLNTTYLLDMASYGGNSYVVAGAVSEGKVYNYKNPLARLRESPKASLSPVALLKIDKPQQVHFSVNSQMLMVQNGSAFATYDAQRDSQYRYDLKTPVDNNQNATWMDSHRLMVISQGKVIVFDYDGTNMQTLSAGKAGFVPYFDRDFKAMYIVAPSTIVKDHVALTRTDLRSK